MKKLIYLTDITLHARGFRPTTNFSKVAEKGRMYSPVPKDYTKDIDTENHIMKIRIDLPKDLQDQVDSGEVQLMMPKDGLLVYAGKDVHELIGKRSRAERTQLIHRNRNNTWCADERGVK